MHEWGITRDLIEEVVRQARANKIHQVTRIEVALGKLSDLSPRALRLCFRALTGAGPVDPQSIPAHRHTDGTPEHIHQSDIDRLVRENQEARTIIKKAKLVIKKTDDHKIIINKISGEQNG